MKIKKLEIQGFKSFSEKAAIEFPPGISAVVGPNGCGKSNVVDALRWVMGEQSVKQLRGKAMEDVIFSGTNGKQPLNMAEVSLILANDNGSAPEELNGFSEIMLTRRLYRSGESSYFINKQPCRLKDVHNIFLGSGLGTKSYAVVQQGSIGAITDAGPEERRVLIEEAAGVTRYKNRKNEALRKVESTHQNLLRLNDIILEVQRQMAGLKRQARKAERYKKYQDQIRKLDISLALHRYDTYTDKIQETDALLGDLKSVDIGHTSQLQKLDAAVEEIKLQRSQKNQEISDQQSQKFENQRAIDRFENTLSYLRKDIERLSNEIAELESARQDLEGKDANISAEISQVTDQNVNIIDQIQSTAATYEQERSASQTIKDSLSRLNQELETCQAHVVDLATKEAQYKNFCQNALNNKESLNRRLHRVAEEKVITQKRVAELQKSVGQAHEKFQSSKAQINSLNLQITETQSVLKQKNELLANQVKRVQTLELERNKSKSTYAALKKMDDNFEWYKDGVRSIMQKVRSSKDETPTAAVTGFNSEEVLGLMADMIEPESSFETAVEAVLGESLQYILVKDQTTGVGAIDYLQTTLAGRSGFIPVSSVKDVENQPSTSEIQSKKLLNHVSIKPGFEKIAQALLGHVLVTDNIQEALDIHNRNGRLQTIVTKNGTVVSCHGFLVGGSQDNLSGILSKKQELKNLDLRIERLGQKLENARSEQKDLGAEVREIESGLQKLFEQKNSLTQTEIEAEKALYKATEDLKHAERYFDTIDAEENRLETEGSDLEEQMSGYQLAIAEIEEEIQTAQHRTAEKLEQISAVTAQLEDFNQKVIDLKLKLTALNAQLENSNNTLKRLKDYQTDGLKRLEQLSLEISQKKQKSTEAKDKIQEFEQSLAGLYEELKLLDQALERNRMDYHSIDVKLKDSDSIISDIQSKREKTLQNIRLLEIEQSQRQIQRDHITQRLMENYHEHITALRARYDNTPDAPEMTIEKMEAELDAYRKRIDKIEDVNLGAIKEYEQLKERFDFLSAQREDLVKAVEDLHKVIKKINRITQERFLETFDMINQKLEEVFPRLFEGGSAKLVLTEPDKPLDTGVEYMIHPPGKKLTRMSLLSGGEKALSAIALIFSIFLIKPASFCLMDEIDATLDEVNIFRFNNLLKIIGEKSQIIMITHNKKSMEFADMLFGITMEKKGVSKVVSVNFERNN